MYQVAQLYCVAEVSKNETGGGEGIEVIKNEPFKDFPLLAGPSKKAAGVKIDESECSTCETCLDASGGKFSSGQYTYKIYHLASKVPAFIRLLAPKGSLEVHEEAWNAYPYCRTVLTNPGYMKDNFVICIESLHVPDGGDQYNLKTREVVHIDIANDPLPTADYKPETDPTKFKSVKTGRGPLVGPNWKQEAKPIMTCYKLVTAEFKQVFCSMDDWHGMTMADIRAIEDRTKEELERLRREGEVRGMRADNE
ncbi:hypothetical protein MSG28_005761 [Choristoneura fumiferana]|uniref:Uncharacterized protein n=1 Tax=Choristoneura fumiferana TaxID=7141 RepID=A0ACC0L0C4_CHOFU|nr:hypothetical protein MSG28_005761 [Choristoneura fumiferana]